jgi:3-methyladenine DNA glycosylase AlkD
MKRFRRLSHRQPTVLTARLVLSLPGLVTKITSPAPNLQSQVSSMTAAEIVKQLQALGADGYKRILQNHGVKEPVYGVKVEELKKIQKIVKKDYQLALDLFNTGIYDAMYLAGLVADDAKMTKKDLRHWAQGANCPTLSEYTVAWVAAEGPHGHELAQEWIDSKKEGVASSGWATLGGLVALKNDAELDLVELKQLLQCVQKTIHQQPNRVRYAMNAFVIAVGSYVKSLTDAALEAAAKIGRVSVDMDGTACKVPSAAEYIQKVQKRGAIGKKRKTVKC